MSSEASPIAAPRTSAEVAEPAWQRWFAPGLFLLAACFAISNLARNWQASVLDRHEYRQVQTLLSAQGIRDDGAALAYPLPLFGPPWSAPMEFPLYQTLVGWTARLTGCSLESAGRAWSVLALAALLPAVWGILRELGWSGRTRWFVLAGIVSSPVTVFYSRTVLIESTAVSLAGWFLFAFVRGVRSGAWSWIAAAMLAGALAAAVKITTFVPVLVLAATAALVLGREQWCRAGGTRAGRIRFLLAAGLPVVAAFVAAQVWVGFGDALKRANPFSEFLVSANLNSWNFGTLALRGSPAFWNQLYFSTTGSVLAESALWLALVALVLAPPAARRAALALGAAYLVGPLCFANLYFVHDYYYHAVAPLLTAAAGLLLAAVWERGAAWRPAAAVLVLSVLGAQWVGFGRSYGVTLRTTPPGPPEIVDAVRAATTREEVVLIGGWDWNATIPYYAERRGLLPRGREEDVPAISRVAGEIGLPRLSAVVWRGPGAPTPALRAWWQQKLGVLGAPAVCDGEFELFVRPAALPRLSALFAAKKFERARLLLEPAARPWDAELKEAAWTDDGVPGPAWPAPFKARSFHGCGEYDAGGGERRIIAHAVTELFIHPPAGAKRIVAEFRMVPAAYERANPGDGAEIAIFEEHAGGARRRLYSRLLQPVTNPGDRGDQHVELGDFGPLAGDLVFAVTPGPAGRADFDWCDWKRIRVE